MATLRYRAEIDLEVEVPDGADADAVHDALRDELEDTVNELTGFSIDWEETAEDEEGNEVEETFSAEVEWDNVWSMKQLT